MAWKMLPTDYTDAVWSGLKKYSQIDNSDGTVSFQDVTVYFGKEKSFFGAKDANQMNEALNTIMSMVENGTDLYEAFVTYIQNLEKSGDESLDNIETGYETRIANYETTQKALFDQWFNNIKGTLSGDVAGQLQEQITELDEKLARLEYMVIQNDYSAPITVDASGTTLLTDDLGYAILADWKI